MKKRLIHIVSFGFLLSVVTEYLACEKRRYFETNLIKFTGQYYEKNATFTLVIQVFLFIFCLFYFCLYRSNCCAGFMLEINKNICIGKYQFNLLLNLL